MDFVANSEEQNREMRASLGINSIEELFTAIPEQLRQKAPLHDDGMSEFEGMRLMESIGKQNSFPAYDNYLGAGAYEHHVPAVVAAICSKSEFLTSYTPYQAEASQGILQAIFEFQSALCALTGLDVANASLYDGASACAEAVLMALRLNKSRNKILVSRSLHPHYRAVVDLYTRAHGVEIVEMPFLASGECDFKILLDDQVAAVLVQSPNFLGIVENLKPLTQLAKAGGVISILCANPLAYGLFSDAAELGFDIAVGDGQPFGIPLQFGGPYVGYMACKQEFVRQLPGRIVGKTSDNQGRPGFVLTLQTREQHIRREKATSNICTNQGLAAIACLVSILWYGKKGIRELALTNFQRASYLRNELQDIAVGSAHHFNEFRLAFSKPIVEVQNHFRQHKIEPGLDLGLYYPELQGQLLVAVTETKDKEQLDRYIACARAL